jgi:hypothetical protein
MNNHISWPWPCRWQAKLDVQRTGSRPKGPCDNKVRLRRDRLEAEVLEALETRLMQPELVAAFVAELTVEWNRLRAEASAGLIGQRRALEQVEQKLTGLIDMMIDGFRAPGLQARLDEMERHKQTLIASIASAEAGPVLPRLHGNLPEVYRNKVAKLRQSSLLSCLGKHGEERGRYSGLGAQIRCRALHLWPGTLGCEEGRSDVPAAYAEGAGAAEGTGADLCHDSEIPRRRDG